MASYHCPPDLLHRAWDNSLPPALTIAPGDEVTFDTIDAADGSIPAPAWARPTVPSATRGVIPSIPRGHPLSGPIAVQGAEPGDTLAVTVLAITPNDWGWTSITPNGVLGSEVGEQHLVYWDLRGEQAIPWSQDGAAMKVKLAMQPFCGVMGLAFDEPGEHTTTPPRAVGGNLDVRQLIPGSTLYLPIAVEGALFSVGDVHAAQGDGEISGTGIECAASVTLRFDLLKGRTLAGPEYRTPGATTPGPLYGVTGVAPDLMEATKQAVRRMIAYLVAEHGLSAQDAYILCSAAVDLAISEVVDPPNWVVSAVISLSIFDQP